MTSLRHANRVRLWLAQTFASRPPSIRRHLEAFDLYRAQRRVRLWTLVAWLLIALAVAVVVGRA